MENNNLQKPELPLEQKKHKSHSWILPGALFFGFISGFIGAVAAIVLLSSGRLNLSSTEKQNEVIVQEG